MKRTRWVSGIAAILLATAVSCGGKSPPANSGGGGSSDTAEAQQPADVATAGAGEEEDESTADLAEHHRHHHHGGFAMFIAMSLDSINATPEQEAAIKKIRAEMREKMKPAHDAEQTVLLALADEIASGKIDQPKLDASIAQLTTAAGGIHDAVAESLNQLHATLTPQQRMALVDKVEAHFEVWHHTNAPDEQADREVKGDHLGKLAKELNLTQQQIDTIRASFKASMSSVKKFDRSEADAHVKAFGAAFASDNFDAKSIPTTGQLNAHMANWGITRTVRLYEAVTPALTPEQRTKLADTIRKHANYQVSSAT